jgi:hypothetical protein
MDNPPMDLADLHRPTLTPLCRIVCEVGPVQSLGEAPLGERRRVLLLGGTVEGPGLQGRIEPGGVDWQIQRRDGVTEIQAQYVIATPDGALIEVQSQGLRHGPPAVMAALARGEAVPAQAYFFRTLMRFATGHPAWQALNRTMALAHGRREAALVRLDVHTIG